MTAIERTWRSPLTLLERWRDRPDSGRLHDVLITGYTMDLAFLERFVVPTARTLGARVTVIADADQGRHDPVDVRRAGTAYQHGHADCRGAFHPKLVLLLGPEDVWLAIGSGNPTTAGWGYNQELWFSLRSRRDRGPRLLADVAGWLRGLPKSVGLATWISTTIADIADRIDPEDVDPDFDDIRVLNNLKVPLIGQLPTGPVHELHLVAPFFDPSSQALAMLVRRFQPGAVRVAVQPTWTAYDGVSMLAATEKVAERKILHLPESRTLHGKLIEWVDADDQVTTLTGSANITAAAFLRSVDDGGNCELAVLAPATTSLFPLGTAVTAATVAQQTWSRTFDTPTSSSIVVLGCVIRDGVLTIEFARPAAHPLTIEVSPSGVPGTWTPMATVPVGQSSTSFVVPGAAGSVVRAAHNHNGQRIESAPVFVTDLARCQARSDTALTPCLNRQPAADEIFSDLEIASRFTRDLLQLTAATLSARAPVASATRHTRQAATTSHDRWRDYLDACERIVGPSLTHLVFPGSISTGRTVPNDPQWVIGDVDDAELADDEDEALLDKLEDNEAQAVPSPPTINPDLRKRYQSWAERWVRAISTPQQADGSASLPPLPLRMLVTRLYLWLLAAGIWRNDDSWRDDLGTLIWALVPYEEEQEVLPEQAAEELYALLAVTMTLLRQDLHLTGGTELDFIAKDAWDSARDLVAAADIERTSSLLLSTTQAHARTVTRHAVQQIIELALATVEDPDAAAVADLAEAGYLATYDDGLWLINGDFTNPLTAAARAATVLSREGGAAVLAWTAKRSVLILWARPGLAVADSASATWRYYRLSIAATPQSRTSGTVGVPPGAESVRPLAAPPDLITAMADALDIDLRVATDLLQQRRIDR